MERKLHLFTDGGSGDGGGISDKVSNQLELFFYYIIVQIYLIIGNSPRPGVPPLTEHNSKSMKAIRSSSTQRVSMQTCKATLLSFGYCAGDEAYFINN